MRAAAVELAGTRLLKILNMVNTKMFEFKHPKYYKELRKRNKSDQAISLSPHDGVVERAPDPGLSPASSSKPQAASLKPQAPSLDKKV